MGTTDSQKKIEIDLDTLEAKELIRWDDDEYCMTGVSHSQKLPDGTVVSICNHMNVETMKMDLMVFKMEGENTKKRKKIA